MQSRKYAAHHREVISHEQRREISTRRLREQVTTTLTVTQELGQHLFRNRMILEKTVDEDPPNGTVEELRLGLCLLAFVVFERGFKLMVALRKVGRIAIGRRFKQSQFLVASRKSHFETG
jgi:hypothetical protein